MENLFKDQLQHGNPITQELLDELPIKNYVSGEPKQVGDVPLWGFKADFKITDDKEILELNLFSLCKREFDFYVDQYSIAENPLTSSSYSIPIFIKKGEEDKYELMKNDHLKII